jgi:alanine racemase
VRVGDEVVVIGAQGAARVTIDAQAAVLSTIGYEVACGYGARLHRRHLGRA